MDQTNRSELGIPIHRRLHAFSELKDAFTAAGGAGGGALVDTALEVFSNRVSSSS